MQRVQLHQRKTTPYRVRILPLLIVTLLLAVAVIIVGWGIYQAYLYDHNPECVENNEMGCASGLSFLLSMFLAGVSSGLAGICWLVFPVLVTDDSPPDADTKQ